MSFAYDICLSVKFNCTRTKCNYYTGRSCVALFVRNHGSICRQLVFTVFTSNDTVQLLWIENTIIVFHAVTSTIKIMLSSFINK